MGGSSTHRQGRRRRSQRRRTGGSLVIALVTAVFGLALPAQADTPPDPARGDAQHLAQVPPDEAATAAAQARAKATGQAQVIDTLTTPYAQTFANPDGTLATTTGMQPARAKSGSNWVPVDVTLISNSDGSISPKAVVDPVRLSGGGSGPLATLTNAAGKTLSVSVPFTLPKPTLVGDDATYAEVLPGVDLQAKVTAQGGIRHVLIVKSATAAANPALAQLKLATSGSGLNVSADANGNLQAVDTTSNTPGFVASAPLMWDSSTTPAPSKSASRLMTARAASPAEVASPNPAASSADGPGSRAQTAVMSTSASAGNVNITPVQSVLAGSGTQYPVYIDPSWLPFDSTAPDWTWIQQAYPGTSNFGKTGGDSDHPGIGLQDYQVATGLERTFYQFNNIGALGGAVIHSATLNLSEYLSSDWSCTNTYPVYLELAEAGITNSTTWNNAPTEVSLNQNVQVGGSGSSGCYGNVPFSFDVTSTLQRAASGNWTRIAFGLHGMEEDKIGFKRLTYSPSLTVTYDRTPSLPTSLNATPNPQYTSTNTTQPCEPTTNPTDRAFVGNPGLAQGLQLNATVTSPASQPVRGYFDLWDDSVSGFPTTSHGAGYSNGGGYVSSGKQVSFTIPQSDLTDGHAYAWDVSASDGLLASAANGTCHFRVDLTPPTVTTPTGQVADPSTTFPPAGNGQTTTLHVGQSGQVPFTAADPSPATGIASGLACVRWGFDPTMAGATWQCGSTRPTGNLTVTPTHWGTNILYIQAQDNAGNYSQIAPYAFYVPWNPSGPAPVFGDTTGDGSPDILVPHSDDNLYAHSVPGNTQATSPATSLAAVKLNSLNGDSWKNYRFTHRGSLRGGLNVDDLIVHKDGASSLFFYYNPGNTGTDGRFDKRVSISKPTCADSSSGTDCTGYQSDWSTATQIAALGDVSTTTLNAGHFQNRTGLLTEETNPSGDAALWFYPIVSDSHLGSPVRLAATGWKNLDLMSPGDWNHTGRPGLWARDRTTGDITAYAFTTGTTPVPGSTDTPPATVPTLTGISTGTKIGNLPAADYPTVGSDGDLTGDGISDLWAVTSDGQVKTWAGKTTDGTASTAVTAFDTASTIGSTNIAADQWRLAGNTTDTDGPNPATAYNTVGWGPGHTGTASSAATFDGTGGYLATKNTAVDTTHSYTVSAWVNLNSLATTEVAVSQGTANHQAFYLGYTSNKTWQFMTTTASASPSTTYPTATGGPTPTTGTWTHLTGVYDADSHVVSLYVNGILTQNAAINNNPAYDSSAPLTIGGNTSTADTTHQPYDPMNGSISDVRTYPMALTATQIQTLYSHS
ncbi:MULTISPECIES: LamG-like jellyroll fold domain-containing protein [unclassified Streptomyces]|uniref:LamG-like jellyroll fold domain-containing protein n=1 Tax=unclassified Streptomyces TaxID=2593676 RepID=UPI00381B2BA8